MNSQVNRTPNRLINEKSPYLLQHADNPVDWYPWSEEAFKKAEEENKPIFLSIGYSTCHWCHVMEKESFETEEAAKILNKSFVAIKVDKEERPDIDAVYMSVCQMLTRSGGWPLTILMTPDQKPFYAGTYLPLHSRYHNIGLIELLQTITARWKDNQVELLEKGEEIYRYLDAITTEEKESIEPTISLLQSAAAQFEGSYDRKFGGFGKAPKFPAPHNLLFLLRYGNLSKSKQAISMAEYTLVQMYRGGIFDHIGGGFSRYSTDARWLVPHFEKMLYDNALLSYTYIEAYQLTEDPLYKCIGQKTMDYVLQELLASESPNGQMSEETSGFYCGQDADSDGVEGKYYVFDKEEIIQQLGSELGTQFCEYYEITKQGNFEGKNILNLLNNEDYSQENRELCSAVKELYNYRLNRNKLHRDDKVLTSWNAMMIATLAKAAIVFENEIYLKAARKAQLFIEKNLTTQDGHLFIRWRKGEAANAGQLDDYAFYAWALLELYESCFDISYLVRAIAITEHMIESFWDKKNGGFYLYSKDSEQLIARPKEVYDGAVPSGNAVAGLVLARLSNMTAQNKWQEYRDKQLYYLAGAIKDYPMGHSFSLTVMLEVLYPTVEIICVTKNLDTIKIQRFIRKYNSSNLSVLVKTLENEKVLCEVAPFAKEYPFPDKGTAYYVCHDGACEAPIYDEG